LLTGLVTPILLLATAQPASADLGKPVIPNAPVEGGYKASVFISPDPPRAGPIEVSVLVVQDRTGKSVVDLPVTVVASPADDRNPKHRITAKAEVTTSTNKMMLSAVLEIPDPGKWQFKVQIKPPTGAINELTRTLDVGEPLPAWMEYAGWVLWPLAAIVLFVVHRTLVRWRQRKANPQPAPAEPKDKPRKPRKDRK